MNDCQVHRKQQFTQSNISARVLPQTPSPVSRQLKRYHGGLGPMEGTWSYEMEERDAWKVRIHQAN